MSEIILEAQNLCKSFGSHEILKNIDFSLKNNEFVSIMGDSGCGKSTFLYLLGGLDRPTSGSVIFDGKNISMMTDQELGIMRSLDMGFIFQFYNLVMNLTVEENIILPLIMAKKDVSKYREWMEYLLEFLNITDKRYSTPEKLSGGQQQKVAIARALISRPKLLLADEPTGNLDSRSGKDVLNIFKYINENFKTAILMITHSEKAASYASKTVYMTDGKL